ncbi:MAG: VWA domain-containing protein [Myxococcales bacterium]|nr:VWA domain-containing protein [Myxococcales bacterium]
MTAPAPLSPTLDIPTRDPRGLGGLAALVQGAERPLPLQAVRVRARILGGFAHTVVEQTFANPLDQPMEAVHRFPLPPDGAVTDLVLRCGDLEVRGDLKEKAQAQADFAAARDAGHRAALVTQERADVHVLRVTRLPAGEQVTVRLEVVEALDAVDGAWRWRFPTTIAPRYLPGDAIGHSGDGVLPDTDQAPDASHLQPPLRLEGGTRLDLEVAIEGPVAGVESSLHAVKVGFGDGGLRVAPSGKATLNADFVLAVTPGEAEALSTRAWTDGAHTLVQVAPPALGGGDTRPRDAVFVVDISGSMCGTKMTAAKQALHTALHGLLPGDRFRLIAFDDRVEQFAADFVAYDERSLAQADRWIERLDARGGTEMLPAIQAALAGESPAERLRTVLFITDGQAWNEQQLVAAVAHRRKEARFFTLGIDTAVNEGLLGRLARVGGGTCELATPTDDIEAVVARMEARFGGPLVVGLEPQGVPAARMGPTDVFEGRPATVLVEGGGALTLTARAPADTRLTVTPQPVDFDLGALWARERIAALEDRLVLHPHEDEALTPQITALSLKHRVICRFTAFIAVETSRVVQGEQVVVQQPAELPQQWDGAAFGGGGPGGPPPMAMSAPNLRAQSTGAPLPPPAPSPARPAPRKAPIFDAMPMEAEEAPVRREAAQAKGRAAPARKRGGLMDAVGGLFRAKAEAPPAAPMDMDEDDGMDKEGYAEFTASAAELDDLVPLAEAPEPAPAAPSSPADPAAELARRQGADGSFGGNVARTAAALVLLVKLGHTRRKGLRRRAVLKAARWLEGQGSPLAAQALAILAAAEAGQAWPAGDLSALTAAAPEGAWLASRLG